MRIDATAVAGVFVVEREVHADARGSFERTFCEAEFAQAGIDFRAVQLNLSRNPRTGTLRGMHYQPAPHAEAKLVQCVRGRILDVALDLRPDSPTYLAHVAVTLDAREARSLFIPEGCAHGFLTLEDDSDVLYHMGSAFVAGVGAGVRWDDPAFGIAWPASPASISDRDATYPDFTP